MIKYEDRLVEQRLEILRSGVESLLAQGYLTAAKPFKKTQREALEALRKYLGDETIPAAERLVGYIEIPTGIGKTGLFVALLSHCLKIAEKMRVDFPAIIIVSRVDLIEQTIDSIKEYAPELLAKTGQYYFKKKVLDKPVLLITYNSWMQLMERGVIEPGDFAMQIPDEGHRILALRRQERSAEHRAVGTIDIAFTATAKYDSERTLERTHKRRIYYKPIRKAVADGELAEYIQTQFFVIRLKPEIDRKTRKEKIFHWEESERRKQMAWTQTMVDAFANGTDAMTGDPLSDNDGAFFAANTRHADITAAALNAQPKLQAIARQRGSKAVAISIHTKGINSSKQVALMKAFKSGDFPAVSGDDKFKEGFDHPPLKRIFDYQRGSIVDKAQIIGRAARKWCNPRKNNRFEGAVVCDCIIYEGSSDKTLDEQRKQQARLNAITAESVLEDAVIQRKAYRPSISQPKKSKKIGPTIIDLDTVEVEAYCSLEQINHYVREMEKLRVTMREQPIYPDGLIKLSDEQRQQFGDLVERAGSPGANRVHDLIAKKKPALCFTYSEISRLRYGMPILIHPDRYEGLCAVLEKYAATIPQEVLQNRFIPFTDDMKKEFWDLRVSRGNPHKDVIYQAATKWARKNKKMLTDFSVSTGVMQGQQKTVRRSSWEAIIQGVTLLPVTRQTAPDHVLVPYTPDMRERLGQLAKSRGNIGSARLYRMLKEYEAGHPRLKPVEADADNIRNLIDPTRIERMKSVYRDIFERAVHVLRDAPEIENSESITITKGMNRELERLLTRAGHPGGRNLRQMVETYESANQLKPIGATDSLMAGLIAHRQDTTKAYKWNRVIEALKAKID